MHFYCSWLVELLAFSGICITQWFFSVKKNKHTTYIYICKSNWLVTGKLLRQPDGCVETVICISLASRGAWVSSRADGLVPMVTATWCHSSYKNVSHLHSREHIGRLWGHRVNGHFRCPPWKAGRMPRCSGESAAGTWTRSGEQSAGTQASRTMCSSDVLPRPRLTARPGPCQHPPREGCLPGGSEVRPESKCCSLLDGWGILRTWGGELEEIRAGDMPVFIPVLFMGVYGSVSQAVAGNHIVPQVFSAFFFLTLFTARPVVLYFLFPLKTCCRTTNIGEIWIHGA